MTEPTSTTSTYRRCIAWLTREEHRTRARTLKQDINRAFTEHPADTGETYAQHLWFTTKMSARFLYTMVVLIIHGVFPFLLTRAASIQIERVYRIMKSRIPNRAATRSMRMISTITSSTVRIGILGFGFSGLMVAANLVRHARAPLTLYIVAEDSSGLGVAYATHNIDHLLNVPTGKMGAFAEDIGGFSAWLATVDAAQAKQALGLTQSYQETDFAPRALYGSYLQTIWRDTQTLAAEKNIHLKLVPSTAVAVTVGEDLAILTQRGDAIAVDRVVLATGHEIKPILPTLHSERILQNPWAPQMFASAAQWPSPVMLMGAGLTMIDTLIMLRATGYTGQVVAFSRHGLLPQAHAPQASIYSFDTEALFMQHTLQQLFTILRRAIRQHGDWRSVIDALRPHTHAVWQKLETPDKRRFFQRLATQWSVHRHRMAPDIAARVDAEITAGTLQVIASKKLAATIENDALHLAITDRQGVQHTYTPSRLINCTGPELNVEKSSRPLIRQLVAAGLIESHATHVGIACDLRLRAWGAAYPRLSAVGSLMTGQFLESTAVPELRVQAAAVAENLLS